MRIRQNHKPAYLQKRAGVECSDFANFLRMDAAALARHGARSNDHWREDRLLLDWIDDTLAGVESGSVQVTTRLIDEWKERRRIVFHLPRWLNQRDIRRGR
ncbi:hypothetical protein [Gordonia sp. CPCC 205333]|uniref:hypothetical protein n=1 Tax=Gordonia sp. CPCC 205333 TaxID=3140790 RepID=UPI003AF359D8